MKRGIEERLRDWKTAARRKPLIVRGARQVGKTWSIEQFGQAEFRNVATIDFEKRPTLKPLFASDLSPAVLVEQLELATGQRIRPGETLLFLDEIQACPRAVTALRYFHEELPSLHVVAAGSLLDFALAEVSVPVGRVSYLEMHPLTFREYLRAIGNEPAAAALAEGPRSLEPPIHDLLMNALKRFLFVGGMPECVAVAADGGTLRDVFAVQDDLLKAYRDDFAKYGGRSDRTCLDAVMIHAARQVGEQLKYTTLDSQHSGQTNRKAFDLLCLARVLHKIPSASPAGLPLGASANEKRFKAAFVDVGLMQRLCGLPVDREMQHRDLLDIYRGKLAEQFVAQELLVAQDRELYYWAREVRGSSAEVDYLVARDGRIHPVEVKSGTGGQLRSLHRVLADYPGCGDGWVLSGGPFGRRPEQRIEFIPLYFAGTLAAGS
ncbi:MAG: ATP-binding protein [Planctomycetia bacterium]